MKGGEGDTIYIYEYPSFPYTRSNQNDDDKQQEVNLEYVALTRAKQNLYLVFIDEDDTTFFRDKDKIIQLNAECRCKVDNLLNS